MAFLFASLIFLTDDIGLLFLYFASASDTLVQPIVVNVGRAGAANLDVIQEVEYVKQEAKIVYLLHCLQKTAPPVIIFCEKKGRSPGSLTFEMMHLDANTLYCMCF